MSSVPGVLNYYFRIIVFFLWLCVSCLLGFIYALVRWGNNNVSAHIGHFFGKGALWLSGVTLHLEGEEYLESHKPAIFVSNHQSAF
eukprot:TRINITY_DN12133_c0_g1_i1.p1 TRINITY_DN12133_c0_g1~~TRINITY_DN12133_c0_g1_i1.p1  ORF type:complete len:101 (+),score=6.27 TRINITY_DN12133_c0_g1_i1:47-304(+)